MVASCKIVLWILAVFYKTSYSSADKFWSGQLLRINIQVLVC